MQKPFATLSQRGQVRHMSALARQALEAYAVPVARVTPLKHVYNTTFRIAAPSGEQYVLRICHPRRTSVDVVHSELLWLAALRQEASVNVPEPVPNKQTQYVTVITDPSMPQPCLCTLFHWIHGRFRSRTLAPTHLLQVGELTARLHHHATLRGLDRVHERDLHHTGLGWASTGAPICSTHLAADTSQRAGGMPTVPPTTRC